MERSDKVKPGESKFGILREPLGEVAAGTTVQVTYRECGPPDMPRVIYEVRIPGIGCFDLLNDDCVRTYVEILE